MTKRDRLPITEPEYELFSEQCGALLTALKSASPSMTKTMGLGKFDPPGKKNYFICFQPSFWAAWEANKFGVFWELRLPPSYKTSKPNVFLNIGVEKPFEGDMKKDFKRNVIEAAKSNKVLPLSFDYWPHAGRAGAKLITKEYSLTQDLANEVMQGISNSLPFMKLVAEKISEFRKFNQGSTTTPSAKSSLARAKMSVKSKHRVLKKRPDATQSVSVNTSQTAPRKKGKKAMEYDALVSKRKSCRICSGLDNPFQVERGRFDSSELGPWTRWQGNLEADILVVGQDWGDVDCLVDNNGIEPPGNPTNRTIKRLFKEALDITLCEPNTKAPHMEPAFFTNAILCLKTGGLQGSVEDAWFKNCGGEFLKETISIVQPRVVVTLGEKAFRTLEFLYGFQRKPFRTSVDNPEPIRLAGGSMLFPMYHCGARILNTHRKFPDQLQDWKRVRMILP